MSNATTEVTIVDALKQAREKIGKPESWTKGSYAKDSRGKSVSVLSNTAASFCALGSMMCTSRLEYDPRSFGARAQPYWSAGQYLYTGLPPVYPSIASYNDDPLTTHKDILQLYDRAIELAEQEAHR